jgi:hypothetical protein
MEQSVALQHLGEYLQALPPDHVAEFPLENGRTWVQGIIRVASLLPDGNIFPHEIGFDIVIPSSSELVTPPAFRYNKPDFSGGTNRDPAFVPTFRLEDNAREGYYPVAHVSDVLRVGHLYLADGTLASDDGVICIVKIEGHWQTRYFPRTLIFDLAGENGEEVYAQMVAYAQQSGSRFMVS